jgi:type I restriction-modification system DNA methylase subunit
MNTKQMETIIGSVRDLLRKEGITGIDSINHCILFIVSRLLNVEMCHKFKIDQKYAFSNLLKDENGDDIGDQDLYNRVYNRQKDCLVGQIMFVLGFMNMKFKLEGIYNLRLIYDKLSQIDVEKLTTQYDIIGTIYEIHLKSGTSNSMRDLGQYYTHRQVIKYMINLCDPQMRNGLIEKIVDPTMGTGGFLTMAIKYLNAKYNHQIDWTKNRDHIIGFDIDENVRNMALLNVLLEMGELCKLTLVKQDTLHEDMKFTHDDTILEKVDVILANEPMGLKNIVHADCCERIKEMKIRGTKAEPLFLQLFMSALNEGGRCAVIVPNGVLFNESTLHIGTRKYLIENFDLKKVVSLNDEFFLNTGVKTSILFFKKDIQRTKEVEFSQICLKDDQILETTIIKVSYQQIKDNNYSLFVSKYNVEKVSKIDNMTYRKLEDVCELKNGKQLDTKKFIEGKYPVYGGGRKQLGFHNEFNRVGFETIVCATGSCGFVNICETEYWASQCFTISTKDTSVLNSKYLYYYCKIFLEKIFMNNKKGSTQPYIRCTQFVDLEILIPPILVQHAIVERLDVLSRNNETSRQMIEEYQRIMKYYVECQTRHEKECKMEDVCQFEKKTKKLKASDGQETGKYRFFTSSQNKILYVDEYEFENRHIVIGRGGCPSIHIADHFSISHDDCYVISSKYLGYLYHYLINNKELLEKGFVGSTIKHLSLSYINGLSIHLPSTYQQQKIVEYCDHLSQMIDGMEKQINDNITLMRQIIDMYLNQNNPTQNIEENTKGESIEKHEINDTTHKTNDTCHETSVVPESLPNKIKLKCGSDTIIKTTHDVEDLTKLTLAKLKGIAKEKGLKGYSKLKKDDLINMIKS